MPAKRTAMRKIRDVLRLRLSAGLSIREISRSTKISVGGIQTLLAKATALELGWPLPDDLDDNRLANLFYPAADTCTSRRYQMPDWPVIHQELKRPHGTNIAQSPMVSSTSSQRWPPCWMADDWNTSIAKVIVTRLS